LKLISKIKSILAVLLIWSSTAFYGQQNLILNPSFENSNVLQQQQWFDYIHGWWQINSVDAFSTTYILDNDTYAQCNWCTPLSRWGYQETQQGNNHIGIATEQYNTSIANFTYNEFVGGYFTDSLDKLKRYKFSFYASVGDSICTMYSKSLQVKLYSDSICSDFPLCQIDGDIVWFGDTMIKQTTDWVKIEFDFIANGGEKAFLLGNFKPHLGLEYDLIPNKPTTSDTSRWGFITYWFLDNFSLTEVIEPTPPGPPIPFLDNITISNNPGNAQNPTLFKVNLNKEAEAKLTIYDEAARIITTHTFTADQEQYKLENLAGAVYFYTFESSNEVFLSGKVIQF
jgi:hypothetical protein